MIIENETDKKIIDSFIKLSEAAIDLIEGLVMSSKDMESIKYLQSLNSYAFNILMEDANVERV